MDSSNLVNFNIFLVKISLNKDLVVTRRLPEACLQREGASVATSPLSARLNFACVLLYVEYAAVYTNSGMTMPAKMRSTLLTA